MDFFLSCISLYSLRPPDPPKKAVSFVVYLRGGRWQSRKPLCQSLWLLCSKSISPRGAGDKGAWAKYLGQKTKRNKDLHKTIKKILLFLTPSP